MSLLKKADILGANDRPTEDVEVPEWGGTVRVATMSGADRDAFEADMFSRRNGDKLMVNFRARLAARCLIDEDGARLFTEGEIEALGEKSAPALDRIYEAATRLNRLSPKDVQELEKN